MCLTYISWAPHCSRSDSTAQELGGQSHMVYWSRLGSHPLTVWLKYLGQACRTVWLLLVERPRAVFVMSPPVFAALVALPYCTLAKASLVIDAHTAAFMHPRWRYFQWLQFWLCRRATSTIVTNEHLRDLVEANGAHATIVPDVPPNFATMEPFELSGHFNIAVVCSFNPDEPTAAVIAAARLLPDVQFYLTGNPRRLVLPDGDDLPPNVQLTGFLTYGAYTFLLHEADAVMTLTTRDHTMLRGAWEAVYAGTPVVVSDWPLLIQSFGEGAVHVDNTPQGIYRGIEKLMAQRDAYNEGVLSLRRQKRQRWEITKGELLQRIRP